MVSCQAALVAASTRGMGANMGDKGKVPSDFHEPRFAIYPYASQYYQSGLLIAGETWR